MRSTGDCEPSLFRRLRRFGGLLGCVIVLYTKSDTRLYTDAVGAERFHMHGLDNRAIAFGLFALFTFLLTPECAKALDNVTLITDFGYNGRHAYFFVAIEKGYYKDADLDVKVVRGQGSVDAIRQAVPHNAILRFADAGSPFLPPPNAHIPVHPL